MAEERLLNIEEIVKFAQKVWGIEVKSPQIIRNSDKLIMEITDIQNNAFILKGEKSNIIDVQNICKFANSLVNILPTTTYLKCVESNDYVAELDEMIFTLETRLNGDEVEVLNDLHFNEIGSYLGDLHNYSLHNNLRLHKSTSWGMFGGNKTLAIGDYDENELSFQEFQKNN